MTGFAQVTVFHGHRASEHAQAPSPWSKPNPGKRRLDLGCLARSSPSDHALKANAPQIPSVRCVHLDTLGP